MAWFLNFYECGRCGKRWQDDWSCMCDDDCPHCGARHMSPYDSADLSSVIEKDGDAFVVFRSRDTAEHKPAYKEAGRFPTEGLAKDFVANIS
jgi:hypothetical protein